MTMEYQALAWLKYRKRCPIVMLERGLSYWSRPDVLGITSARYLVEIEIKRSMSDFRANSNKRHVVSRNETLSQWPKYYYFLVPSAMSEKVKAELPTWAGLMVGEMPWLSVVVKAPPNHDAKRVSFKRIIRLVELQSNNLVSMKDHIDRVFTKVEEPYFWTPEI